MNRRTLRRIALGAVLAATIAGMTALWFQSRSVDVGAHAAYDSSLREARRLDRTLNQDVLSARFNLVHSYDALANTEAEVEAMASQLADAPAFLADSDRARLIEQVGAYRDVLREKVDAIERFKGHNSILRNSLRYLPTAAARLNERIASADPSSALAFQVLAVLRRVLVYNITADESLHDEIATSLAALDADARRAFPGAEWRPFFGNFARHVETVTREKPIVDELVAGVLESPIAEHEAALARAYEGGYGAATAEAERYRLGLYALSVALLALVVFAFWRLTRANATLEQRVGARTAELSRRNREMELVFDNMEEALLTLEPTGVPVTERSARAREWFGPPAPGKPFWQTLAEVDPRVGPWFKLGWESLREGFLPPELCLEQMPATFVREGRHFRLRYRPIDADGRVLLIATDMTDEIVRLRAERGQREIVAAFGHSSRDRSGFIEFLDEAERLAARVTPGPRPPSSGATCTRSRAWPRSSASRRWPRAATSSSRRSTRPRRARPPTNADRSARSGRTTAPASNRCSATLATASRSPCATSTTRSWKRSARRRRWRRACASGARSPSRAASSAQPSR